MAKNVGFAKIHAEQGAKIIKKCTTVLQNQGQLASMLNCMIYVILLPPMPHSTPPTPTITQSWPTWCMTLYLPAHLEPKLYTAKI